MRSAAASALSGLFAACGGLSDAGQQESASPTAVAHVVGYAGPDSDGNVTIDVRAQSELALTGKESIDADKPIIRFLWTPDEDAKEKGAKLTVRNSTTVAVSVPQVSAVTEMQFTLTVEDSDGDTDTATVTLTVHPVLDSDQFLQDVRGHIAKLRVVAATNHPIAESASPATFQVQLRAQVAYTTRSREANDECGEPDDRGSVEYDVGQPVSGTWLRNVDATVSGADDFRNPLFQFAIPGVDLDAITRQFQDDLPESAASLADPACVDDAKLALSVVLSPFPDTGQFPTMYAGLFAPDVLDANGNPVNEDNGGTGAPVVLTFTAEQVSQLRIIGGRAGDEGGGLENEETAQSYYQEIDPSGSKSTLQHWLVANCFDPAAANYGADAHAVYVNNFDLGFGRDMYFRSDPDGCTSPGDVASVVINYPTLEAAAKKIDPVIAVAMEYKPNVDPTMPGLVTFYAFAPDLRTGDFRRVRSVNFDGRGEKFLPGACTACHGGHLIQPDPDPESWIGLYANTDGNVDATFMPFDLESFLYSDGDDEETDATFPTDDSNADLRADLTRSRQEAEFRKLNFAVYSTYGGSEDGAVCFVGYEEPCELIDLWYDLADPLSPFENNKIPPDWQGVGGADSPEAVLYRDVFRHHCRACHTQQVGGFFQFGTYDEFISLSRRSAIKSLLFDIGGMPGARLTMDRFWQPGLAGEPSAGQQLIAYNPDGTMSPPFEGTPPGDAVACFTPFSKKPRVIAIGVQETFSSKCSNFASSISWQLTIDDVISEALSADQNIRTAFTPETPGNYKLTLTVTGPTGGPATLTQEMVVP